MRLRVVAVMAFAGMCGAACGVEGSYDPRKAAEAEARLEADKDQPPLIDNLRKFASCMRGKGLEYPDPDEEAGDGAGDYIKQNAKPGDPAFEAADDACRTEVFGEPTGGPGGERGPGGGDDPD